MQLSRNEILDLFDLSAGADAIRNAYIAQSQDSVESPDVTYLGFPSARGDCHVKSGFIHGTEGFVVKVATGFYDNPARGLPSSNGLVLLLSSETGQSLAILQDEGWLTDIRTGLGGAVATMALAQPSFSKVLVVGGGTQARHQAQCLHFLAKTQNIEFTFWARNSDQAKQLSSEIALTGLNARSTDDLKEACSQSDVIITTTPSTSHLIHADWIRPGTHITAIGADSPGKQELDVDLINRADLNVCDALSQSLDHGEFQSAHRAGFLSEKNTIELGHILGRTHPGRINDADITIADLTGLAVQDAAAALTVYRAALAAQDTKASS